MIVIINDKIAFTDSDKNSKEQQLAKLVIIGPHLNQAYVHMNTGKPYWKKKGVKLIPRCQQVILDLPYPIDLRNLFIKFEGESILLPLKDYCEYY